MASFTDTQVHGILNIDNDLDNKKQVFTQYVNDDYTYECNINDAIVVGSLPHRCIGYNNDNKDSVLGDLAGITSVIGNNVIFKGINYVVIGSPLLYSDTKSIILNSNENIVINSVNNKNINFICNAVDIDGKILIDSNTYGSTLPASGTIGQVFFKLV